MRYTDDRTRLTVEIISRECLIPDDERERMQRGLRGVGNAVRDLPESELRIDLIYHPQTMMYHARFEMHLPGRSLFSGAKDTYLDLAFQKGVENLLEDIVDYQRRPDRDAVAEAQDRLELRDAILAPEDPRVGELARAALDGDYRMFRTGLAGYEDWLRLRVGRWLQRYPHAESRVGKDVLIGDLIEEVYLMAFESFARRPTAVPLHEWLNGLIDPAVKNVLRKTDQEHQAASLARTVREAPLV